MVQLINNIYKKLVKKYNDLLAEKQKLNKEVRTEPVVNEATINRKNISDDLELNSVKDSTVRAEPEDTRIKSIGRKIIKNKNSTI